MAVNPRMVLVTRLSDYEILVARHGTRAQAEFFLGNRGQSIKQVEDNQARFDTARAAVLHAVPANWRSTRVDRGDLDRFVFEPRDVVVALGQDGLVANLAKYLNGQLVLGLNPMPDLYDGILVRYAPHDTADLLLAMLEPGASIERRTMAEASLDDGQSLLCLNEVFIGHRSHQSARYQIEYREHIERQSSSGMIVATGTGATGWARSIHQSRHSTLELPRATSAELIYFVREPWPSIATGTDVVEGLIDSTHSLTVTSEMDDSGVIFGDGIESDHLVFGYGQRVKVRPSDQTLNLFAG